MENLLLQPNGVKLAKKYRINNPILTQSLAVFPQPVA